MYVYYIKNNQNIRMFSHSIGVGASGIIFIYVFFYFFFVYMYYNIVIFGFAVCLSLWCPDIGGGSKIITDSVELLRVSLLLT